MTIQHNPINSLLNSRVTNSGNMQHYGAFEKNSKPQLLLLTQVLPFPPDAGPKIKTFNLIKYLSRSFSITLVSFVRPYNSPEHALALLEYCQQIHTIPLPRSRLRDGLALLRSLISIQPFLMVRDQSVEMTQLLSELVQIKHFDAVHADQLNMAQYALALAIPARLLDQHNAVWTITDRLRHGEPFKKNPFKRLLLELETFKLRRYEPKICRRFDSVLAVSAEDAAALGLPCQLVPIGVDTEETQPLQLAPGSLNLVSLGTMFYPPNVEAALWFGEKIFPLIQRQQPKATYTIIGANPPASIYNLAATNPNIHVSGYVKDLSPLLQASAGLVVPLLSGGGMRVKILDALALGLPIVSTTVGAEGIQLEHNKTALLADTPPAFAEACLQLLDLTGPGRDLAQAGRALAVALYDFRRAYQPLDQIYSQLLKSRPA